MRIDYKTFTFFLEAGEVLLLPSVPAKLLHFIAILAYHILILCQRSGIVKERGD